ncbi:MAG: glycosyltransferase [Bacteriovoracaceae bacterium]|nr:glycosyltransferase [Bacteriovoracaceae bacterium]
MLSIIVSSFNEFENAYFWQSLEVFHQQHLITPLEVIVVDGGSMDGTWEKLEKLPIKSYKIENSNRAKRIKKGIRESSGEMLLLHHPRNLMTFEALVELQKILSKKVWGGFTHSFDQNHLGLRWTSFYSNYCRLKLRGIIYLDHGIFFHRELISMDDFPEAPIFEDTLLSYELRRKVRPLLLKKTVKTSAIRFQKSGFLKQAMLNQISKVKFHLGQDTEKIEESYEKDFNLNR